MIGDNMIAPNKPRLVITVGLPKSGKSTYVDKHGFGWSIICPDDIRWDVYGREFWSTGEPFVWAVAEAAVRSMLRRNQQVIVDATNTTKRARSTWVRVAHDNDIRLEALVFNTSLDGCIEQARQDDAEHMIPIIERMHRQWEPVTPAELDVLHNLYYLDTDRK